MTLWEAAPRVILCFHREFSDGMGHFTRRNVRGLSAALLVLVGGAYLVLESLQHPIDGSDFALLGGAFAIALSSFIALYIVRPPSRVSFDKKKRNRERAQLKLISPLSPGGKRYRAQVVGAATFGSIAVGGPASQSTLQADSKIIMALAPVGTQASCMTFSGQVERTAAAHLIALKKMRTH